MASLFGDDGVEDLLNDNVNEGHELPSDDDDANGGANIFGEENADGEQKAIKIEPKKRAVRNPRPRLTVETLRGQRGLQTIEEYFKDIKYKGKGHEKQDLDEVLHRLQHWGHRMYPTYKFDDVLAHIERLGKKKPLQVHMSRYRLGMLQPINPAGDGEVHDDDELGNDAEELDEPFDEFDALLGEQIAISKLAPRTPAQNSRANTTMSSSAFNTPALARANAVMSTPMSDIAELNYSDLAQPLPPSQPETPAVTSQVNSEQMARIAENRRIAQQRLQAKRLREQQQQEQQQSLETAEL